MIVQIFFVLLSRKGAPSWFLRKDRNKGAAANLVNEKLAEGDWDAIDLEETFENFQIILVEALKDQYTPRKSNLSTDDYKETN